jgi:CHASE2 domain-containing sensor protein
MNNVIILNLGKGSLTDGFPFVNIRLELENKVSQSTGNLAPASELCELYSRWQLVYNLLYKTRSIQQRKAHFQLIEEDDDTLFIDETGVTHVSDREFFNLCDELQKQLNCWLNFAGFYPIERQLRKEFNSSDEIRFIIETEAPDVKKLPWHLWQFFQDYPHTEIAFSSLDFESRKKKFIKNQRVRILAILGDGSDIDIQADKKLLEHLPDAETIFLAEPTRQELDEQLWDKKGWDIFFFAGHSITITEENCLGQIYINQQESLTISQLKNALNRAIAQGLQLAIFNSCQGLGLAEQLSDLHIPQIIVMREPVPDRVAQHFLKNFLTLFAGGHSLYLAVREARERLQGIEGKFPGASWLPVIFQNPAEIPATWKQLRDKIAPSPLSTGCSFTLPQPKFSTVLMASIAATALITGARWLGTLQTWELKAFDWLIQSLPAETADKRILIIGADEEDIRKYGYPLPDDILVQLLQKLEQYQPAAIGIDIFRDRPVPEDNTQNYQLLIAQFQGISVKTVENNWQFDDVVIKRIEARSSGYQDLDARGNQLLIYYRNTPQIAQQVTVRDILEKNNYFNPEWIENRVILIGVTAPSVPDFHDTPFGKVRGSSIHAHVVSQLLSAVEDKRPLWWWLPPWGDVLWIFFWSSIGGIIVWRWQSPLSKGLVTGIAIIALYVICWSILTKGGWMPFIPSLLVLVVTQVSVFAYTFPQTSRYIKRALDPFL